ncbi:MAG: hypothetical protein LBT66_07550 [Methanobrevibacter sp.]|jgi:hypothetical protein|nr:hypothetical protein [Candidatus Methanovirga meridionalis]
MNYDYPNIPDDYSNVKTTNSDTINLYEESETGKDIPYFEIDTSLYFKNRMRVIKRFKTDL